MLDYSHNPELLADAFRLVRLADHIDVAVTIGEYRFDPFNDRDAHLLDLQKLLSLSELGWRMELVRDMLNEALGQPKPETSPEKEVADAVALLLPHLRSGFINSIRSENGGISIEMDE